MTDFYSLLKQSIIDRGISNTVDREEVYAQARSAMVRQLWAFEPRLSEHDINQRIGAFDAAVNRIEADLVAAFADLAADAGETRHADDVDDPDEPAPEVSGDGLAYGLGPDDYDEPGDPEANDAGPYDEDEAHAPHPHDDRPSYNPMPPREGARRSRSSAAGRHASPPEADCDPPPDYHDDDDRGRSRPPRADRWTKSVGREPVAVHAWLRWPIGERDMVRVLLGAIGGLAAILIAFGIYWALPAGDDGVTVPIGVRREVSDAATALRIAAQVLDVQESFVVFDGRDPTIFETSPNNPVRLDNDGESGFARVSSSTGAAGVKALVGPGLAARLAGRQIRVTITARASLARGAGNMRFAYQSGFAISHWQTANLSQEYAAVGLLWRVPTQRTSPAGDYLLIEPGIPGDGAGADIRSIRIDVLAPS